MVILGVLLNIYNVIFEEINFHSFEYLYDTYFHIHPLYNLNNFDHFFII
jgi:hypothetical protein